MAGTRLLLELEKVVAMNFDN